MTREVRSSATSSIWVGFTYSTKRRSRRSKYTGVTLWGTALTAEMEESVDSCDQLDGVVELYTECIQSACDSSHTAKALDTKSKTEFEGLKKDANTKKWHVRNAAPSRRRHLVEEYVSAKKIYERAAADAQTASWKRFCSAQDREIIWDGVYRVARDTGRSQENILLKDDSGRVYNPDESAVLLADTFFLMASAYAFPHVEGSGHKSDTESRKDDYSRPKSYGFIGLLCNGQTVERMFVCHIKWRIMLKQLQRQYGFMPQRGTEDSCII
ncbi:hypothetical protein EVAR_48118_1 [Eumeta japonica]|uniref:Uncharacterized protein n=1 Tax=Eumeta variegata TaxID=151549 RepID=A0A4C2ABU0_EUMVA|nr:hypothetical protein EVAR_48118_1 [Eumeta japonica]